jgi:chemotaxis protein MotB
MMSRLDPHYRTGFQQTGNIEPERLTASGFSFYKPVDTNETDEGRKQNRRIEIILIPER